MSNLKLLDIQNLPELDFTGSDYQLTPDDVVEVNKLIDGMAKINIISVDKLDSTEYFVYGFVMWNIILNIFLDRSKIPYTPYTQGKIGKNNYDEDIVKKIDEIENNYENIPEKYYEISQKSTNGVQSMLSFGDFYTWYDNYHSLATLLISYRKKYQNSSYKSLYNALIKKIKQKTGLQTINPLKWNQYKELLIIS